ncbi:GrpB family protein [Actinoplanes sp. NPDC051411]|uniref:GrpB family protein n=1 Tax=Actinoplanes sp. NPDC051411 TaxID=3155522 RepID=UPI0034201681
MSLVVPYDPAWRDRGVALAAEIRDALGPLAVRVEHIGSTSIPGMAAKPLYDLQVSVTDLEEAAAAFDKPLAGLGLGRRPWERDHVPAGHDDPPSRWAKRLWSRSSPPEPVNLHCRVAGSPNERLALLFRDWFRAHELAIPAYARFKESLSSAVGDDMDLYTDVKDPVVDLVVAVAEEWAAVTGWTA